MQVGDIPVRSIDDRDSGEPYGRLVTGIAGGTPTSYQIWLRVEHKIDGPSVHEAQVDANMPVVTGLTQADLEHLKLQVDNVLGFSGASDWDKIMGWLENHSMKSLILQLQTARERGEL